MAVRSPKVVRKEVSYEELKSVVKKVLDRLSFRAILKTLGKENLYDYYIEKITAFVYAISGAETSFGTKGYGREWLLNYGTWYDPKSRRQVFLWQYEGLEQQVYGLIKEKIIPSIKKYGDIPETPKEITWFAVQEYKPAGTWEGIKNWVRNVWIFFRNKLTSLGWKMTESTVETIEGLLPYQQIPPRSSYVFYSPSLYSQESQKQPQQKSVTSFWEGFKTYSQNLEQVKKEWQKEYYSKDFLGKLLMIFEGFGIKINIDEIKTGFEGALWGIVYFVIAIFLIIFSIRELVKE